VKKLFLLILSSLSLFAEFEVSGHVDLDSEFYLSKASSRESSSFTAKQTLELKYLKDDFTIYTKLYAQEAFNDFLEQNSQTHRTFARVDEFYLKFDREDDAFQIGKSIKFWGSLEFRNIVDAFNPNEFRDDMFSVNKLGVYNASYSYFTDSGVVSLIVKFHEQDLKMAQFPYVYYPFPEFVSYEKNLQTSKSQNRPSVYLSYSGSTDTEYALDYAFIYENGYDSQRYFSSVVNQPTRYVQNAYLVDKFMTYNTLVVGATLLKLEALYGDVESGVAVGDYSHIAFGIEHTFEDFESGSALGFIGEYYKYTTYESSKLSDLQLYETMQDDLFIGLRYTLNDEDDTSIVGGVVADMEYSEQSYYAKYESRFGNSIKVECDYYYIEPSKKVQTAYSLLGRHQRVGVNIAYYF
jgi:hypothetical protein